MTNTRAWLDHYYRLVDSRDVDGFTAMLADDARMIFANADPVVGRENIRAVLSGLLGSVDGIRHVLTAVHPIDDELVAFECDVFYLRKDGKEVSVRGAGFFEIGADGLCRDQRIFVDLSPVYA